VDTGVQQTVDLDPSKHHIYQGQQHHEHPFSLMDPVHPAKYGAREQQMDEHFAVPELPTFNPTTHMHHPVIAP